MVLLLSASVCIQFDNRLIHTASTVWAIVTRVLEKSAGYPPKSVAIKRLASDFWNSLTWKFEAPNDKTFVTKGADRCEMQTTIVCYQKSTRLRRVVCVEIKRNSEADVYSPSN